MSKWLDQAREQAQKLGYIDDRNLLTCANAQQLPRGDFGLVALCINHTTLTICDADVMSPPDMSNVLYQVPLKEIQAFKGSAFPLNRYFKFTYGGMTYHFKNFGPAKEIISAVSEYL